MGAGRLESVLLPYSDTLGLTRNGGTKVWKSLVKVLNTPGPVRSTRFRYLIDSEKRGGRDLRGPLAEQTKRNVKILLSVTVFLTTWTWGSS